MQEDGYWLRSAAGRGTHSDSGQEEDEPADWLRKHDDSRLIIRQSPECAIVDARSNNVYDEHSKHVADDDQGVRESDKCAAVAEENDELNGRVAGAMHVRMWM